MRTLALLLALAGTAAHAAITVQDDAGNRVTLARPALRVISTAPHITELLFAAGGGERVVGAMNYSDYPEAAKRLPVIGTNAQIDMERLLALRPDLLVVWQTGNTERQLAQLKSLGIPIFYSEPKKLDDIATSLTRLGQLLGTDAAAQAAARDYRQKIGKLSASYAQRSPVRVFYQIWEKPLFTLNGEHIVSDALRVCGGSNIFAGLKVTAPSVSTEAVLQENPEAIIGSEQHDGQAGINIWRPYKGLQAVQRDNLFMLDSELLVRATPRIADGMVVLCEKLEAARKRRP
ncbi:MULTISPECIES: cobalamin-binding protein [unclassified Duganella]|jgi:iron complex transport system substrate-binding protein|uniref:cobalamin-binding protein n=1 Tax=unclassified Duganella TaxID=2636909 RepID=UPI000889B068|nr:MULTISPECIES: cobalamin-binding protein [unclassified Duganella]SDH33944.1 iron complex transport system substrate-binding protein [Duganella sp. OV458]SDK50564.1 iron complex transport system substrate-binding protein [Duganella sp. OV510]